MGTTAPYQATVNAPAVSTAGNDLTTVAAVARNGGTVAEVTLIAASKITGADTNNRSVKLVNKGQAGTGSTVVAELEFAAGVDAGAAVPTNIPLSGTAGNLVVKAGDVLVWQSLHANTGIADPGGLVRIQFAG